MAGGFLGGLFGDRPSVPPWQNISLDQQQKQSVAANQAALPGLESLAGGVDVFNQQQLTSLMNTILPGWSSSASQAGKNISSELSGEIPTDVSQALQSSDAAKSLTGGFGGSGLAGNLTARDLGITSLDLMGKGLSSMESWSSMIDQMFAPGQFNISSMFISPQQEFQDTFENQEMAWGQQWLASQVRAMPNPQATGLWGMLAGAGQGFRQGLSSGAGGGSDGGHGGGGMAGMGSMMSCCFIFLESYHGVLPDFVRKSRDRYYRKLPTVAAGYRRMAKWLVPLMQKSHLVRSLVWRCMVQPLTEYGGFTHRVKGYEGFRANRIYRRFWFGVWSRLGEQNA